jgi:hypothetical protein
VSPTPEVLNLFVTNPSSAVSSRTSRSSWVYCACRTSFALLIHLANTKTQTARHRL